MRIAGALTTIAGVLLAAVLCLLPVQYSVLGTSGSCGPPLVSAIQPRPKTLYPFDVSSFDDCKRSSMQRVVVGSVLGSMGVFGGYIMIGVGLVRRRAVAARRELPPGWWTDGRGWYPPPGSGPPATP